MFKYFNLSLGYAETDSQWFPPAHTITSAKLWFFLYFMLG